MNYALWALGTAEDIEARGPHGVVDALVAYFDMGREVDPYEVPCLCLSPDARADCEDCEGTGLMEVDHPVDSRFDWFAVGGRWSGACDGTGAGRDVVPIADLTPAFWPSVIVVPDGTWYVNDDLDDGARNSAEPEAPRTVQVPPGQWAGCVADRLLENKGCLVVVADMHA